MRIGGWLEQFRRPAAVPAAAADELSTELLPVFAALDDLDAEAARLREETARLVADRIDAAKREAERLDSEFRRRADEERERARVERLRELAAEAHAIEEAGNTEAERVRREGRARIPALAQQVVTAISEERA